MEKENSTERRRPPSGEDILSICVSGSSVVLGEEDSENTEQ